MSAFRVYEPWECGSDGYPLIWHKNVKLPNDPAMTERDGMLRTGHLDEAIHEALDDGAAGLDFTMGVKHLVRALAGHRCERCKHPYELGSGTWGVQHHVEAPPSGLLPLLELDGLEAGDVRRQMGARPPLWSDCDMQCEHGGPARARVTSDRPWLPNDRATFGDVRRSVRNGNQVQASWRILTVHHLNGRKHDLRWWNLCALCQRCHLEIQGKVTMERIYPLEHTEWFRPHAAGWYAYAYLGLDLNRAEALERMEELLALERLA